MSRLGPTLPIALAAASVWQTPQCSPNSVRPSRSAAVSFMPPTWALAWEWLPVSSASGSATPKPIATNVNMTPTSRLAPREGRWTAARTLLGPPRAAT